LCETRHRVCCSATWDANGEIWFMRYRPFKLEIFSQN
jgi:hypothetical protein